MYKIPTDKKLPNTIIVQIEIKSMNKIAHCMNGWIHVLKKFSQSKNSVGSKSFESDYS